MGLDCSHDAFHGSYRAFDYLRRLVCAATGGSYPPHWVVDEKGHPIKDKNGRIVRHEGLDERWFYFGDEYSKKKCPGLTLFLSHSDCDGEISPEMCTVVADELSELMPKIRAMQWEPWGHIVSAGGYAACVQRFIAGGRAAAKAGEALMFE